MDSTQRLLLRTLGLGVLAGMRSLTPPALLSLYRAARPASPDATSLRRVGSVALRTALVGLAIGELVGDKLPQTPDRISAPPLLFRGLSGGGTAALLWSLHRRPAWLGGLLGAGTAVVATYATFYARGWLGRILAVPNAVIWSGLIEDALVLLGGWAWLRGKVVLGDTPDTEALGG